MTSDLFVPMASAQKLAFVRAYLDHLRRNNGEIDGQRRFPRRDATLEAIVARPIAPGGPLSDRASLWAVTTAKANLSEHYAMERQIARSALGPFDRDDPASYIDVEEQYHSQILAGALAAIGVRAELGAPPVPMRILIAVMIRLPRSVSNVVILAAEIGGVALFRLLLEQARTIFADEPQALSRIEPLLEQILADEIGHVLYVRSRLGRARLWLSRRLALPIVARLYRYVVPELAALIGPATLRDRMAAMDLAQLRRIHPEALAADALFTAQALAPLPTPSATEAR